MNVLRKEITPHRLDVLLLFMAGWSLMDMTAVPFHPYASENANLALKAFVGIVGISCFVAAIVQWRRRDRFTAETDGPGHR